MMLFDVSALHYNVLFIKIVVKSIVVSLVMAIMFFALRCLIPENFSLGTKIKYILCSSISKGGGMSF